MTETPASQVEQLQLKERLAKLRELPLLRGVGVSGEMSRLKRQLDRMSTEPSEDEVWHAVELARHQERPYTLDYVERICEDFVELHGDRSFADDPAIVAGLARIDGRTVVLVGHQKGRDIRERTHRNFGMTYPEGYRKAMRAMELADRHRFPVLTLVDTPGAYPGVTAEQHGQGGWIARCQLAMVRLGVPTVTCVIGEGGSGGAVAIAVADRVLMQENAIYSVISPEGCAAILWRDAGEAKKAAAAFKPDARHCLELGVVDGIVPEPPGGAHTDHDEAARLLGESLRARSPSSTRRMRTSASARGAESSAPWASTSTEVENSAIHSVHRVIPVARDCCLRQERGRQGGRPPVANPPVGKACSTSIRYPQFASAQTWACFRDAAPT